jgi:8-oxo-dGTP pyrophosphatase MutT (NUDIX family)
MTGVVSALLFAEDGRVLFGLRASWKKLWPNQWDSIGGHIEEDETPEETLLREVREEIGVTPTRWHRLTTLWDPTDPPIENHLFVVTQWAGGEPRMTCDEHSELRWFTVSELAALPDLVPCGYPDLIARHHLSA